MKISEIRECLSEVEKDFKATPVECKIKICGLLNLGHHLPPSAEIIAYDLLHKIKQYEIKESV